MSRVRIGIIGGGIVGLATARQLLLQCDKVEVVLWEKETAVGQHQSTHNSGVLHAGLYYQPGSRKARLAVRGLRLMTAFCQKHGIAHDICGKIVVATAEDQISRLKDLQVRGQANGLAGVTWLKPEEIREIEPHAAGLAGLRVPEEGIVDYAAVCDTLARDIKERGGTIRTGSPVKRLRHSGHQWRVQTPQGEESCDYLVACAGLHADRVARLAHVCPKSKIVPFRGEYYKLRPDAQNLVRNLIYPVPDPVFPFLGVHFTRLIHGGVEAGPNAVLALAREGYRWSKINPRDLAESLLFPGLWKFAKRYPRMCWDETRRSFSRALFCQALQTLVPAIQESDLVAGGAGVRAQAMSRDGTLVQDFDLLEEKHALHVLNAPSPAATASLAIGEEIAQSVAVRLNLSTRAERSQAPVREPALS